MKEIGDWLLAWQTLIAGAIAFVGAWVTVAALRRRAVEERTQRARTASMLIASQLRFWLQKTSSKLDDHDFFEKDRASDPNDARMPVIPDFPFERSPGDVAALPSQMADSIFQLMERKASAESGADFTAFVETAEDAAFQLEVSTAKIWFDALAIYANLAKEVGWTHVGASESAIKSMRERIAEGDAVDSQRSASAQEIELSP